MVYIESNNPWMIPPAPTLPGAPPPRSEIAPSTAACRVWRQRRRRRPWRRRRSLLPLPSSPPLATCTPATAGSRGPVCKVRLFWGVYLSYTTRDVTDTDDDDDVYSPHTQQQQQQPPHLHLSTAVPDLPRQLAHQSRHQRAVILPRDESHLDAHAVEVSQRPGVGEGGGGGGRGGLLFEKATALKSTVLLSINSYKDGKKTNKNTSRRALSTRAGEVNTRCAAASPWPCRPTP